MALLILVIYLLEVENMDGLTVDSPGLIFFDSDGFPYAVDKKSLKCFLVFSDKSLEPRPKIVSTDLRYWASPLTKSEALKLAAEREASQASE